VLVGEEGRGNVVSSSRSVLVAKEEMLYDRWDVYLPNLASDNAHSDGATDSSSLNDIKAQRSNHQLGSAPPLFSLCPTTLGC
jgi:hypothetical protein